MTSVARVTDALRGAGISSEFVQVVEPDARQVLGGPVPDRWFVTPVSSGGWVVGAFDRGSFAPYDTYETVELLINALRHLRADATEFVTLDSVEAGRAAERARGLDGLVRGGHAVAGGDIAPGTAFDTYGTLANHTMFVWRTPFPARSNPPTDLERPYLQIVTRQPLPDPVRSGVMAPAFEQPGGGVALSLPRCLRWYYDTKIIDIFRTAR